MGVHMITDLFYIFLAAISLAIAWYNYCQNAQASQTIQVLMAYMIDKGVDVPSIEEVEEYAKKLGFEE